MLNRNLPRLLLPNALLGRLSAPQRVALLLHEVERSEFTSQGPGAPRVDRVHLPELSWRTGLTPEMVSVALLQPSRMRGSAGS